MNDSRDKALRVLKRMLANGRLTAVPKRPADQELLMALAASQFAPDAIYDEGDINERLKVWLDTVSEPFGIDHVTLRRMLVDSRLLMRTSSGSTYRLNADRVGEVDALRDIDLRAVLAGIQVEREQRKRGHAA